MPFTVCWNLKRFRFYGALNFSQNGLKLFFFFLSFLIQPIVHPIFDNFLIEINQYNYNTAHLHFLYKRAIFTRKVWAFLVKIPLLKCVNLKKQDQHILEDLSIKELNPIINRKTFRHLRHFCSQVYTCIS